MGEMTLEDALEEYKSVYMAYRNFAERTRVEYSNDLSDLMEFLEKSGVNKVGELKLGQIESYLAHLENRGFAGATRKRKAVTIRSFLSFLFKHGYISSNIAKQIIPPYADNKFPMFLTEAEYNRLKDACARNPRDAAIVELLLQTGIRLSELTHLTLDDVEFFEEGGLIRIIATRGREGRTLSLNIKVSKTLHTYIENRSDTDSQALFLNRFGEPLGDRGVQKMLRKYLNYSNVDKASVHTLRHTFAIHHAMKGTDLKTISKVMGHKDTRSTSIYTDLAREATYKEI